MSVELDPLDTEPWNTHTVSTDADGTVTGDNYDYNTATDWNNDHTLTPADIAELDEQGTSELVGTLQQEAYQGDVVEGAVPTVFTESFFDDANGYNAHELDGGTYDIDVGLLDNNPGTPDTSFDGAVQGLNPPATVALARAGSIPVIASGGLAGMADIEALVRPEHAMLEGAIAGRALYDGRVDVGKALGMMGGG